MSKASWVCLLLFCSCVSFASAADERVLYNGKIFTGEPEHPYAEAVAIRGDKIVAVGNRGEVSKAVAPGAESIDLKGNLLLPGLIDSHCHAVDGGLNLISAEVDEDLSSVDELVAFAADAKKSGRGHARGHSYRERTRARLLVEARRTESPLQYRSLCGAGGSARRHGRAHGMGEQGITEARGDRQETDRGPGCGGEGVLRLWRRS